MAGGVETITAEDVIGGGMTTGDGIQSDPRERLLLLRREVELQRRRLVLSKESGLAFYKPHPGQQAFHAAGSKKHRMMRCGNRYGKSTMGCAEDIAWLLGARVWLAKDDPNRALGIPQHPVKGLVITTDWDKVDEIWTSQRGDRPGKFWQMIPKGSVKSTKKNHSGATEQIELTNGSMLRFDTVESFKKNPAGSESSDWDFIHVDEPCPEAMFKANARGLMDRNGSSWFTMTPLSEFWINDMFFPARGALPMFPVETIWAKTGNTSDNPYLSTESIANYTRLLTAEEAECRLYGKPMELSGLVYKNFDYDRHVLTAVPKGWVDYHLPPRDYIIYASMDVHPQTPHAVLFVAVNQLGQRFIYDELWVKTSAEGLAKAVLMKLEGYNYPIPKCDPIAWINDPITETCIAEEFMKHGLLVEKSSKSKTHGILKMQGEFNKHDLFVSPNVTQWLFEINRYCYDKENKPSDKDDHLMECMYRLFINDPTWYNASTPSIAISEESITKSNLDLGPITMD